MRVVDTRDRGSCIDDSDTEGLQREVRWEEDLVHGVRRGPGTRGEHDHPVHPGRSIDELFAKLHLQLKQELFLAFDLIPTTSAQTH